ncbi:MAG: FAD-dependent oxidoreductase [Firmicutes bacterium]|nr:FAD-dependent oxidoreductase [Bacillota bacterium]
MKLIVVGGVAGGASAAARVRRLDPSAEVIVMDRGDYVSYSNCALPYYLSGMVEEDRKLVMMWPEGFKKSHDIEVRVNNEVIAIDRANKKVLVRDLKEGREYEETYDKLVLSPGASPIMPASIKGIDGPNVFSVRTVNDVVRIKDAVMLSPGKRTAVVGGGFVGIEVAENLAKAGQEVTLVEGLDQILQPFDYDMVQILHKEMDDNGVKLYLKTLLKEIKSDRIVVEREGETFEIETDNVVVAIGVKPETDLAKAAGLEIGTTGGIKVNENYQTSDPDIYAVGDAIEQMNTLTGKSGRLAMAGPAQRQARAAADHMYGRENHLKGFIGSCVIRVFGQNAAATGLNEKACEKEGINYETVIIFPNDKVGIMPNVHYMAFKLIFEVPSGKILGAQAIGRGEADKRVDVIAAMITMGGTLEDLKELELCYAPLFTTAKDVVNFAALVGLNLLNGDVRQVHLKDVRELVESGAYIIDVREPGEFANGHIIGAHNIPQSQIRQRLDEIPRDIPVYLHCRSSQRSYYCYCALKGRGFDNLYNIQGSFLGISLYEYFNDKDQGRKPIVDNYNFK